MILFAPAWTVSCQPHQIGCSKDLGVVNTGRVVRSLEEDFEVSFTFTWCTLASGMLCMEGYDAAVPPCIGSTSVTLLVYLSERNV